MEFTKDNVVSAAFLTNERNMIQVIYKSDDGNNRSYNVPADPERATFQNLMSVMTLDEIENHTENRIQAEWQHIMALLAKAERDYQLDQAEVGGYIYDFKSLQQNVLNDALKYWVLNPEKDEAFDEQLFSFKLSLFDDDEFMDTLDDGQKDAVRTSDTFLDIFKVIALAREIS